MNHRKILFLTLIILTFLTQLVAGNSVEVITKPIARPLSTLPSPVLSSGELRVELDVKNEPTSIIASLQSIYDEGDLTLIGSPIQEGSLWILNFNVPDIMAGLYDLHITYSDNNHIQPRSVWVMDSWPTSLTINHNTDIHQPYGGINFTQYIYEQNLMDPDMILCTGDVVDVETIRAAWENLQGTMQFSRLPIYLLPGNHDHTSDAKLYKQYGGKTNYTLTIGDFFIVAINSQGGGYIRMDELAWADKVLSENPDKVKIVAFHHPLFSSEYEDDKGTMKGGYISGDWQNIEALEPYMYFTWVQNIDNARELLKVIQENDVKLILTGHVHRDMIYILNDENYFITTTTVGGSSSQIKGYRQITISSNGEITLDPYAQANEFNPPNCIPLDHVRYLYKQANDGTRKAVSAIVENGLDMPLNDARLEFVVDSSIDSSVYSFTKEPDSCKVVTAADGYHFIAYYDIPAESTFTTTLYAESDSIAPDIKIVLVEKLDGSEEVSASIEVTDLGWGVDTTKASYSYDGVKWTNIPLSLEPDISPTEWTISYSKDQYFTPSYERGEITFKVEATDFTGNTATDQSTYEPQEVEPETEPANIVYNSITASPTSTETGGEVIITITLENTGGQSGTETIELIINDELIDTETITVAGGATETATFTYTPETAGTYSSEAGTKTTIFTATAPEEPEHEPEPSGGMPFPAAYVIAGIFTTMFLLSKRRLK